ncbi:MAG: hypothetical protein FWG74_08660 [Planctomycetes bacterium]|nr:hypothetical protein [Planctomycetota bacterium]
MPNDGDRGDAPRETPQPCFTPGENELAEALRAKPNGGGRPGGLAFLALLVLLIAALHYHLTGTGTESFPARLNSDLLTHTELTLTVNENGSRMAVVPAWPLRLYYTIRRDIAVYAFAAVIISLFWGWSARARARRDLFLVHEKLEAEIAELRRRLDKGV